MVCRRFDPVAEPAGGEAGGVAGRGGDDRGAGLHHDSRTVPHERGGDQRSWHHTWHAQNQVS